MSDRVRALLPLLCVLVALGLRLVALGELGLWGDEGWTVYAAHGDLGRTIAVTGRDIHPPLYFVSYQLWRRVAGPSEFALRYLSVFPGVLVVAVTVALGKRLAGRGVGTIGAMLVAWSPFAVHYAQEARPFMWATLWSVCALYLLFRALPTSSRAAWIGYGFCMLLAALTLYSTAAWFAAHGALLLLRCEWRRRFWTWLVVGVAVLALLVPWAIFFGRATGEHLIGQGAFTLSRALPLHVLSVQMLRGLLAGVTLPAAAAWTVSGVLLVVGLAGVLVAWSRAWERAALLLLVALLPLLAFYPIHLRFPWFRPRVLAFCVVPLCLSLAVGLDGWRTLGWPALAAASLVVAGAFGYALYDDIARYERYSLEEDYRPLIAHVQARASEGDVVLYNAPWHVGFFDIYYRGPALSFEPFSASAALEAAAGGERQVWLVLRDIVRQPGGDRPEDRAEDLLSSAAFKVGDEWFGAIRLAHYAVAPDGDGARQAVDLPLGGELPAQPALRLCSFAVQPGPSGSLVPGQALYVTLIWEAERALEQPYHVFAQLAGLLNPSSGNPLWAQHDGVPANQDRPTTEWQPGEPIVDRHVMWVDGDAPPGEYALLVGMYDPATGTRLAAMQLDGTLSDHVVLARVQVRLP